MAEALDTAEAAYGVDADHVARELLIGLLLNDAASLADVYHAIERGLSGYAARRGRLRAGALDGLPSGEDSGRSALAT